MKYFTILVNIALLASLAAAAPTKQPSLVKFHPITQSQYEEILGLTKGKPVISEGRLISSGVAKITGFASGLATSWLPSIIRDYASNINIANKDKTYPLCVIDSADLFNEHPNRPATRGFYDNDGYYHPSPNEFGDLYGGEVDGEVDPEVDGEVDTTTESNPRKPIVNCIVVIKREEESTTTSTSSTSTTTTTTKKPTTKKPTTKRPTPSEPPSEHYPHKDPWFWYYMNYPHPSHPQPYPYPYPYYPYPYPHHYPPPPKARQNADVFPQFHFDQDFRQLPFDHNIQPLRAPPKQTRKIQNFRPVAEQEDFDSEEFENDDDFITVRKNHS